MDTKDLIAEIISLPIEARVAVIDSALKSLNPPESQIDEKWIIAAKKRKSEIISGEVKTIPGEKVFSKIWNKLS